MTYTSKLTTPLKFHKFLHYIYFPICIIAFAFFSYTAIFEPSVKQSPYYEGDMVFTLFELALCIAVFVGFFTWQLCAWYATILFFLVSILYAIFTINDVTLGTFYPKAQLAGSILWFAMVYIYYKKRKPLFNGSKLDTANPSAESFCGKCGKPLQKGVNFCPHCGANISF
ncbi:MAG: zinc ribbon domain-containing protein [Desulfovibrio sp.]|jgi:hypothetical protein|nr:zinc ribbon domain-containing protein [Desulfovibrio sp.]